MKGNAGITNVIESSRSQMFEYGCCFAKQTAKLFSDFGIISHEPIRTGCEG